MSETINAFALRLKRMAETGKNIGPQKKRFLWSFRRNKVTEHRWGKEPLYCCYDIKYIVAPRGIDYKRKEMVKHLDKFLATTLVYRWKLIYEGGSLLVWLYKESDALILDALPKNPTRYLGKKIKLKHKSKMP